MIRTAAISLCALTATPVTADESALAAFADHCFSPFLTAEKAAAALGAPGRRVDFYDLDPFSAADPSPAMDRAVTPDTDRRCEIAFDGDAGDAAADTAVAALTREGITDAAPLPAGYSQTPGTTLLGARFLNPNRIAVVHTGTRPGPNGIETFLLVERQRR